MLRKMTIAPTITRRSDELTAYLNDIARYQPLTADEEIELAEAMRNGDAAAKDRFVKANLRFCGFSSQAISRNGFRPFRPYQRG